MGRPRKQWEANEIDLLVRMRRAGKTWREIGLALGKPHITCSRYWTEVLEVVPGSGETSGYGSRVSPHPYP